MTQDSEKINEKYYGISEKIHKTKTDDLHTGAEQSALLQRAT